MKSATTFLLSLVLSTVVGSAGPALAVCEPSSTPSGCLNAADKSCDQFGQTTLDGDQKNIVACLKNNSGGLEWKAMTSASSQSFIPGHPDAIVCHDGGETKIRHLSTLDTVNRKIIYNDTAMNSHPIFFNLDGTRYSFDQCVAVTVPASVLPYRYSSDATLRGSFNTWAQPCVAITNEKCYGYLSLQQLILSGKTYNISSPYTSN